MTFYPLSLRLKSLRVLVVGGGRVATRKVDGALAAGARIRVIAPLVTARLLALAKAKRLEWKARGFRPDDVRAFQPRLVFTATDDSRVNRAVAARARQSGALVNVADDPAASDFHVPAVLRRAPIMIAVSTGGASPATAAALRDLIASSITRRHAAQVRSLSRGRNRKAKP